MVNNTFLKTKNSANAYKYDITAFGEILIDFTNEGINQNGQKVFAQNPGGAPANVAVCASKLGINTAFIGKVGKDMHGEFLKQVLDSQNVNTDGLVFDDSHFTTLAFVDILDNGERKFSFARKQSADTQITEDEINLDILDNSKILHIGSLSLTDEPSKSTTCFMIKRAKQNKTIISYDPNYRESLWENEDSAKINMRSLIQYVDIMKISDEEVNLLTDKTDVEETAKELYSQGVKIVAITLGSEGVYIYNKDGGIKVYGFNSNAVDTNGAGDSFWGGFLYKISKIDKSIDKISLSELKECAIFANAVASICVEHKGAIPAMPQLDDVLQRMKI